MKPSRWSGARAGLPGFARWLCGASALAGSGCASTPVYRTLVGGEFAAAARGAVAERAREGSCRPTVEVTVTDARGLALAGASLVVSQRMSTHAIEETLAVYDYQSDAVRADAHGHGVVCDPSRLAPPPSAFEGIGGGFTLRSPGRLVVTAASQRVEREGLLNGAVRVVLGR